MKRFFGNPICTTVLSVINMFLFGLMLFRDWRIRRWMYEWDLYSGPNTLSDHALSLHLGLLQVTMVCIGIGIAALGLLGFNVLKDIAKDAAEKIAKDTSREIAGPVAMEVSEAVVTDILAVSDFLSDISTSNDTETDLNSHDINGTVLP